MIPVNNPSHSRRSNHHRHNNRLHNIRRQVLLHFCAGTFSLKVKNFSTQKLLILIINQNLDND